MKLRSTVKLVECPRDAMQGWPHFISTEKKVQYLQSLLAVGFNTIDFGSFVSPKAIPQMADTASVLGQLDLSDTSSKLLAIVANRKGAEIACGFTGINYLGYPFSVSETFQRRNTNSSIHDSFLLMKDLLELCNKNGKELVIYISMGFGNPYGDQYAPEIVLEWIRKLVEEGSRIISLADTVGLAEPETVAELTKKTIESFPGIETGVHLHASVSGWESKVKAALDAGCRRIDSAMKGIGGCPMANDELIGNLDTEKLIPFLENLDLLPPINQDAFIKASGMASGLFTGK
jgi:hydroxymethylglutaryl-CoA lyase